MGLVWSNESSRPVWHPQGSGLVYLRQKKLTLPGGRFSVALHLYYYRLADGREFELDDAFDYLLDIPLRVDYSSTRRLIS